MMIHFASFVVNGLQPAKAEKSAVLFVTNGHTKSAHQVIVSFTFAFMMISMNRHLTILRAVDF